MAGYGPSNAQRGGLNARSHLLGGDQVQIRVDPGSSFDYDQEVDGLAQGVARLKAMTRTIHDETKEQSAIMQTLAKSIEDAQFALKRNVRRLNRVYKQASARHMLLLVVFCFLFFIVLYFTRRLFLLGVFIFGRRH